MPGVSKRYKFACTPIDDSDQPARMRRLNIVFDGRSMGSPEPNVSTAEKLRL